MDAAAAGPDVVSLLLQVWASGRLRGLQQPKPIQGRWLGWQAWGKPSARHPSHPGSQLAQWHLPRARRTSRASDHMSGGVGRGRPSSETETDCAAEAESVGAHVRRQGPTDRSSRNRVRKRRDRNGSQPSNGSAASKEEIGTSPPSLGNSRAARCWVAPDRVLQAKRLGDLRAECADGGRGQQQEGRIPPTIFLCSACSAVRLASA